MRRLILALAVVVVLVGAQGASSAETITDCIPPGPETMPSDVEVCPPPQVTIGASPNPVAYGGYTTLQWTTMYAWTCTASGGWSGTKGIDGSQVVGPLYSQTRFILTCTNDSSTPGSSYVDVYVNAPPSPPPPPSPSPPPPSPPPPPPPPPSSTVSCTNPTQEMKDKGLCDAYALIEKASGVQSSFGNAVSCPSGSTGSKQIYGWITWRQPVTRLLHWRYTQTVAWCWNATKITKVSRTRFAEIGGYPLNPWSFQGHVGNSCSTESCSEKATGTVQRVATQGSFKACALFVVFCVTKTPYIELEIQRGGGWTLVKAIW